jgi:hypothetical protein
MGAFGVVIVGNPPLVVKKTMFVFVHAPWAADTWRETADRFLVGLGKRDIIAVGPRNSRRR